METKTRIKLVQVCNESIELFPSNSSITIEFDGDCSMDKLVEGFRMFAAAIGYGEKTINAYLGGE